MLQCNVSQKGYGNALIGRYGGCFEEIYKEVCDDRAYHAKGLDAPARWTPTLGLRRGQCTVPKRLANMRRWKCQLSILTLVRITHAPIIGNSQSNKEVHKETSTPEEEFMGVWLSLRILDSWYVSDEGVTPRLLRVRIPGAYEDRRPAGS